MIKGDVLGEAVEIADQLILCLGASVGLALVEYILRHLELKHLGWLRLLENAVLAEAQEALKEELGDREADDQPLPRKEGSVEDPSESLESQWSVAN